MPLHELMVFGYDIYNWLKGEVMVIRILKGFVFMLLLNVLIIGLVVKANDANDFQKSFFDIGYKEVNEALKESESYYKRTIPLPVQIPAVAFTHSFGRLNNYDGENHDELEIEYVNKDIGINHYKINIRPMKHKLEFSERHIDHTVKLSDGSEAIFSTWIQGFQLLVFEKNDWQYILSIDNRISDMVTQEVLVEIANSIQY